MDAQNMHTTAPCRCGGQAKVFGPSPVTPHSHWGIYCSNDSCDQMVVADNLEEAMQLWNHLHELVHA